MAHITIYGNRLLVEKAASLLTFFGLETAVFATDKPTLFRGEIEIADLDFDTRLNKVGREVAIGTGAKKKTTGEKAVIYQLPVRL
jgi:hypothetical protein